MAGLTGSVPEVAVPDNCQTRMAVRAADVGKPSLTGIMEGLPPTAQNDDSHRYGSIRDLAITLISIAMRAL
jgi:hypothetical protein